MARNYKHRGKGVRKDIASFYEHKKHYSKTRANYLAGAVAFKEHGGKKKSKKSHKKFSFKHLFRK